MARSFGDQLLIECGRCHQLAVAARASTQSRLVRISERLRLYHWKDRIKSVADIRQKVERKRFEFDTIWKPKLNESTDKNQYTPIEDFNPSDVEDAWGFRFIALLQPEIVDVLEELIDLTAEPETNGGKLRIKEIIYYSNRPHTDPLSIENLVREVLDDMSRRQRGTTPVPTLRPAINPESGYSSLHVIITTYLNHDGGEGRIPSLTPAQFEVQIRDVFEDGWGELSHKLAYKRKSVDQFGSGQLSYRPNVKSARSRELNALKASADAISQHATLIDRSLTYLLDSAGLSGTQLSISNIRADQDLIIRSLPTELTEVRQSLADAYNMLAAAHEQSIAEIDNSRGREYYSVAAAKFREVKDKLSEEQISTRTPDDLGLPIKYYLDLEYANAMVSALSEGESGDRVKDDRAFAINVYEALLTDSNIGKNFEAVIKLRLGQAYMKKPRNIESLRKASNFLNDAEKAADDDPVISGGGAESWRLQAQLELAKVNFYIAEKQRDVDYLTHLQEAMIFGKKVAERSLAAVSSDSGYTYIASKCINNALYFIWFYLRALKNKNESLPERELADARRYISLLRRRPYRRFVESHTEFVDTIMRAALLIEDLPVARLMAEKNISFLTQIAHSRMGSQRSESEENIKSYLDGDEMAMLKIAKKVYDPFDEIDDEQRSG